MKDVLGRAASSSTATAICAALVVLILGGAYALASSTGTIKACVHHAGGGLYIGRCATGDRSIAWNLRGPRGPQGLPGPTASSWTQMGTTGFSPGDSVSVDLKSGGGMITTTYPSRIQASAAVTYFVPNTDTGHFASVGCSMDLLDGTTSTLLGDGSEVTIPAATTASFGTVAVVGSRDVPAGTYNVKLTCGMDVPNSDATSVGGEGGSLNVIAIKR